MRTIAFFLIGFLCIHLCEGQTIQKRLILIGDAGEINHKQSTLIHKAAELVKKDSTVVFFLGDNIYPSGMALAGKEKEEGIRSLQAQFEPFRQANTPVYFIAGNHDWNVSRKGGLEKLKAQADYIASLDDKDLNFVPKAGTPGPVRIPISDDFVVIAYDSEYWLYPYHEEADNLIQQRNLFNQQMADMFLQNEDKTVLVLSHHPMLTYGEHSLSFNWQQHIFPLRKLNKSLYIPLPIVGSLYPLGRGVFYKSAEDLPSEAYQSLVRDVMDAKAKHKNVLFVAGHDHGLQFIETPDITQVVSGSGSKSSFIRKNKNLKYKFENQGFCIIDCMDNGAMHLSYYIFKDSVAIKSYEAILTKK